MKISGNDIEKFSVVGLLDLVETNEILFQIMNFASDNGDFTAMGKIKTSYELIKNYIEDIVGGKK